MFEPIHIVIMTRYPVADGALMGAEDSDGVWSTVSPSTESKP